MMPFCNNLKLADIVEDSRSGRRGRVAHTPRDSSTSVCVLMDGMNSTRYIPVEYLRLVIDGKAENVPPVDGDIPKGEQKIPAATSVIEKLITLEAQRESAVKLPDQTRLNGEHLKHYLVTYVDQAGKFSVERIAANGIMTALSFFYTTSKETAIVSVVCVL